MNLLWLVIGIALPSMVGWLLLSVLEWKTRLLTQLERWVLGFVLGLTFTMFCLFLATLVGVPVTLYGFLGLFVTLLLVLGALWNWLEKRKEAPAPIVQKPRTSSRATTVLLILLGLWVLLKLATGAFLLSQTPPYFDDTIKNWNYRGKIFFYDHALTLTLPPDTQPSELSSYPPTVSLSLTWLATLAGTWDEGLVNLAYLAWFIASLLLVYCFLRRQLPFAWAAAGAYLLASLPLYFIHGTNAYADVFLSVHLLACLFFLYRAVMSAQSAHILGFLRLCALATALLTFTKNEALLIYLPALSLLILASHWWLWKEGKITGKETARSLAWFAVCGLLVSGPWVVFKWMNGLSFGNAKSVSGLNIAWQPNVLTAVYINTFFEGNWLLLFPLVLTLLLARWRPAFRSPLLVLSALILIVYMGQLLIYMFTGLSTEAIMQTGYARGLIQLMPAIVILTVILLYQLLKPE